MNAKSSAPCPDPPACQFALVAAEDAGWDFLDAASQVFLKPDGGEIWATTTYSWSNPLNGHAIHFWGSTRKLFVAKDGTVIERFEQ